MVDEARLRWALVVSLLLHALVVLSASTLRNVRLTMPALPPSIDVDLAQLPPPAPKPRPAPRQPQPQAEPKPPAPQIPIMKDQIVTPPDAGEEKPPENTNLLSDRDNVVEKESVKRSDSTLPKAEAPAPKEEEPEEIVEEKPAQPPKKAAPVQKAAPAQKAAPVAKAPAAKPSKDTQVASLPGLNKLFPHPGEFAGGGGAPAAAPAAPKPQEVARRNLLPGQRQAFAVRPGVSDFLPTIHEGDITLLNTKAEKFAPFVRRVAARVFQHMEINLKRTARSMANPGGGHESAVVEAVMNKRGEFLDARLIERETNTQMAVYKLLLTAARPDVFFDANPPSGAEAADGNIHFILVIDLMIQVGPDPRTGGGSVGYYGMASVGLDVKPGEE